MKHFFRVDDCRLSAPTNDLWTLTNVTQAFQSTSNALAQVKHENAFVLEECGNERKGVRYSG